MEVIQKILFFVFDDQNKNTDSINKLKEAVLFLIIE